MSYSEESLQGLEDQILGLQGSCNDLNSSYLEREFTNEKAKEFVRCGLCRRLSLMTRCVEMVFEVLPPNSQEVPDGNLNHEVTIYLQAFVFNAYGCLENLAHIWVLEKNVKQENGHPLPRTWVGLGSKNDVVLKSLPKSFADHLSEIRVWYENLESFRHALAHRIPLYIPPGYLADEKVAEYADIQTRINEAVRGRDFEAADRLEDAQRALLSFHPIVAHLIGENLNILYFHAQMLNDFHTVREIASRLLPCFD